MEGKGFPTQWINWVMDTVKGGEYVLMLMEREALTLELLGG